MNIKDDGVWVSVFIIMGKDFNPDSVMRKFTLNINESWNKDQINPTSGELYNYGSVTFDAVEEIRGRKLEEHLYYWIDVLEQHEYELGRLRKIGCDIFIECWVSSQQIEGVTLEHAILTKLAQLSVDIEIRFYPSQTVSSTN